MKIGYIADGAIFDGQKFLGVSKKIKAQTNALSRLLGECVLLEVGSNGGIIPKVSKRLPFCSDGMNWDKLDLSDLDGLYIRKPGLISKDFLEFAKKAKQANPNMVIVLEIPTYPYDEELKNIKNFPILLKERKARAELPKTIDAIASMVNEDEIFGLENIHILNGIDLKDMQPRKPSLKDGSDLHSDDPIHVLFIASFEYWHGVDRIIQGMVHYNATIPSKKVIVHLVGGGGPIEEVKKQIDDLGIADSIIVHGYCDRDQVDGLYDKCSIAVDALGNHRKGILLSSSLKSREYIAKGMPFVYCDDIDFMVNEPADFFLRVPADDSPINIQEVVDFHKEIYGRYGEENLIEKIRDYAGRNVDIDITMKPVADYFNDIKTCA